MVIRLIECKVCYETNSGFHHFCSHCLQGDKETSIYKFYKSKLCECSEAMIFANRDNKEYNPICYHVVHVPDGKYCHVTPPGAFVAELIRHQLVFSFKRIFGSQMDYVEYLQYQLT